MIDKVERKKYNAYFLGTLSLELRITGCCHVFHRACIQHWYAKWQERCHRKPEEAIEEEEVLEVVARSEDVELVSRGRWRFFCCKDSQVGIAKVLVLKFRDLLFFMVGEKG